MQVTRWCCYRPIRKLMLTSAGSSMTPLRTAISSGTALMRGHPRSRMATSQSNRDASKLSRNHSPGCRDEDSAHDAEEKNGHHSMEYAVSMGVLSVPRG